jgi:anti-sigma factor RsiW
MMARREPPHVADVVLEQYRLGELPKEDADRVGRLLQEDQTLRGRVESLDGSDAEIERRYPPPWFAERVRERLAQTSPPAPRRVSRLVLATALVVGGLAVAIAVPWGLMTPGDGDRLKGLAPALAVYRRTATGSEALADGTRARPGDLLRLGYVAAGRRYGVILSIDGRGAVTVHLPPEGGRAAPLASGGTILLDHAFELDDAPAYERFFFVTADHAFEVAPIVEAVRAAAARSSAPAALAISREFEQTTFSVLKEESPR